MNPHTALYMVWERCRSTHFTNVLPGTDSQHQLCHVDIQPEVGVSRNKNWQKSFGKYLKLHVSGVYPCLEIHPYSHCDKLHRNHPSMSFDKPAGLLSHCTIVQGPNPQCWHPSRNPVIPRGETPVSSLCSETSHCYSLIPISSFSKWASITCWTEQRRERFSCFTFILYSKVYNPNSQKVGTLCKMEMKTECNDLRISESHVIHKKSLKTSNTCNLGNSKC